jgi:hypothetical protein
MAETLSISPLCISPLCISMDERDNVAILASDGGLPGALCFVQG